jgi:biotin operon repressor
MMLSLWKLNPRQDSYDLSTEEIGQMVGLTRNTVSKCLQELEHAGLVQRSYARLQLQPVERLEAELAKRSAN